MSGQDDTTTEPNRTELVSTTGPNLLLPNLTCSLSIDVDLACQGCGQPHYFAYVVTCEKYYTLEEAQAAFEQNRTVLTNVGYRFRDDVL